MQSHRKGRTVRLHRRETNGTWTEFGEGDRHGKWSGFRPENATLHAAREASQGEIRSRSDLLTLSGA